MEVMETPLMSVRHLYKQFGTGCIHCQDGRTDALVGNYCPHCGTVYACRDLNFDLCGRGIRQREIHDDALFVF